MSVVRGYGQERARFAFEPPVYVWLKNPRETSNRFNKNSCKLV